MFSVGDTVGDYEIVAQLRSGGMATLFLGRREGAAGFAKHVAIKVIHEHLAEDPAFVQMFVEEALLSARIEHPNVVHVEELREVDGRHFLVMEYVYGCSLSQLLHVLAVLGRRLTPELAVHIAIKIADGLHAAHEVRDAQGRPLEVVHRDVTPQNLLLAYQGTVKLIDFGVAKSTGRAQETEAGSIKGKFRYMSPEQAFAKPIDRRTDVYALGIVLWEMLTMKQRFDANSDAGIINRVRYPEAIPPSRHSPEVSEALDAVVLKAMAVEVEDRYQTAHELRAALVEASPSAAGLHESVLGQLLALVMKDAMKAERDNLPSSIAGMSVTRAVPASVAKVEAALRTMTLALEGAERAPFADDRTDPAAVPELPTQMLDASSEMAALDPVDAAQEFAPPTALEPFPEGASPAPEEFAPPTSLEPFPAGEATPPQGTPAAPVAPPASRPAGLALPLPLILALVVGGGLGLGLLVGVTVLVLLLSDDGPPVEAQVVLPSDPLPVEPPPPALFDAGLRMQPRDAGPPRRADAGPPRLPDAGAPPEVAPRPVRRRGGATGRAGPRPTRGQRRGRPIATEF